MNHPLEQEYHSKMVTCKKCKKDTNIVCLCGLCPRCNGMDKKLANSSEIRKKIDEISKGFHKVCHSLNEGLD